ncbi:MAG: type II toxin-antitoxin system VapC family toxin [Planctomycetes bacterium]|nr:type II toxin-antitoxin system VapC family toxin [Planctomycetota bacterium]
MGVKPRIYLDSCVAIYAVESASHQGPAVTKLISQHQTTHEFCASDLVRMECRVVPLRTGNNALLGEYERFLASTTRLDITPQVFELATELRARHALKTPDAIHLAVALAAGCAEVWTNDGRWSVASSQRVTIRKVP